MTAFSRLFLAFGLLFVVPLSSRAAGASSVFRLPEALSPADLQALLQSFVNKVYLKGFRHLGDERDFDHGHVLYDAAGKPLAVLYHTQELARGRPRGSAFAYVNAAARNWIQWIANGRVENAARYKRRDYPRTAQWDWFRAAELPELEAHRTILDKMLDPTRVAVDAARTRQWVFTRVPCAGAAPPRAADLHIVLPTRETVCLALSAS